ncbi:MAG: cation:proton antiporter [Isosphaeraceae bacterium]
MHAHDLSVPEFLGILCLMFGAAKLFGLLARLIGQPSVLGELTAGVVVGKSVLGVVDPSNTVFHLLGELGVVILLFSIGLETDLAKLLRAGGASTTVAIVGVVAPFLIGYAICRAAGLDTMVAVVTGAALTATSVGITARVLSDLGRLQDPEGQVILGAAILDDIVGLVILTVIAALTQGRPLTPLGVAQATGVAFGFLVATVLVGRWVVPRAVVLLARYKVDLPGTPTILALMLAFGLGWLADSVGSAVIIGAFAAGLLIVGTPSDHDIEVGVTRLGHFFVPLFFVVVGAAVDVRTINPLDPASHRTLLLTALLTVGAVVGKFVAGYAPFWFKGRKSLIGAGMIPRGEVGLIFAGMGRDGGVFDDSLFTAVTLVVLITTFLAPPLLKWLSPAGPLAGRAAPPKDREGIEDLATEG